LQQTYDGLTSAVNFGIMPRPDGADDKDLNDWEKGGLIRADEFKKLGSAYALFHATKPSTIGLALAANPLALLVWYASRLNLEQIPLTTSQDW
jgi:microsomal epoxide hydrolase